MARSAGMGRAPPAATATARRRRAPLLPAVTAGVRPLLVLLGVVVALAVTMSGVAAQWDIAGSQLGFLANDPASPATFAAHPEFAQLITDYRRILSLNDAQEILDFKPFTVTARWSVLHSLSEADAERAFQIVSMSSCKYLAALQNRVVKQKGTGPLDLPAFFAQPLVALSRRLQRPPIVSYASLVLHNCEKTNGSHNWQAIDSLGGPAVSRAERGFYEAHCLVEEAAARPIAAGLQVHKLLWQLVAAGSSHPSSDLSSEHDQLARQLQEVADGVRNMTLRLKQMYRHVAPAEYWNDVRPLFKVELSDKSGIRFLGVPTHELLGGAGSGVGHGGTGQTCFESVNVGGNIISLAGEDLVIARMIGPTGAQTSSLPFLDGVLGIGMHDPELAHMMTKFREFWPAPHRRVILAVEEGPQLRDYVRRSSHYLLRRAYDDAVGAMGDCRAAHVMHTEEYILAQMPVSPLQHAITPNSTIIRVPTAEAEAKVEAEVVAAATAAAAAAPPTPASTILPAPSVPIEPPVFVQRPGERPHEVRGTGGTPFTRYLCAHLRTTQAALVDPANSPGIPIPESCARYALENDASASGTAHHAADAAGGHSAMAHHYPLGGGGAKPVGAPATATAPAGAKPAAPGTH